MTTELAERARRHGILTSYTGMDGRPVTVPDRTLAALLETFGASHPGGEAGSASAVSHGAAAGTGSTPVAGGARCLVPAWLKGTRVWGIALQLYQLRSARNLGIGDFADLSWVVRRTAALGADFVGLNPLHALFIADPERASPFSPSSRRFLDPRYIALDDVPGHEPLDIDEADRRRVRETDLVDYQGVVSQKRTALVKAWSRFRAGTIPDADAVRARFEAFREAGGEALEAHALFEALSERMVEDGHGAGWTSWPERYHDRHSETVTLFAKQHHLDVAFHAWLQWLAHEQLAAVKDEAQAAGMRVGLYLDIAVGVAADGSDTWFDPALTLPGVRIGAPPDLFSVRGQDWGLAPLSPPALTGSGGELFGAILDAAMAPAGAVRIDHVMALNRMFLIPEGETAETGTYVLMPMAALIEAIAKRSHHHRTVVIGEDLGLVPDGFREIMRRAELQSYRIAYFETEDGRYRPPSAWPRAALACFSTHDLPALAGWWQGVEIERRLDLGMIDERKAATERAERAADRAALLATLVRTKLLNPADAGDGETITDKIMGAAHGYGARTRCRLFAVRLEDLVGDTELVNLPGTDREHPNWRRKLALPIETLFEREPATGILGAVATERPR